MPAQVYNAVLSQVDNAAHVHVNCDGVPLTDGCNGWEHTERGLRTAPQAQRRATRAPNGRGLIGGRRMGRGTISNQADRLKSGSVKSVAAIRVIGHIAHALELRQLLQKSSLDAVFQGDIHRAASLATAAESQHREVVLGDLDQGHLAPVGRQRGIHFVVQHVIDAIFEGGVFIDAGHLGIGRLDGELSAHAIFGVVHQGVFQKGQAAPVEPGREPFVLLLPIALLHIAFAAVGDTGFGARRTRLVDKYPDAQGVVLFAEEFREVVLGAFGDRQHGALTGRGWTSAFLSDLLRYYSGPWGLKNTGSGTVAVLHKSCILCKILHNLPACL